THAAGKQDLLQEQWWHQQQNYQGGTNGQLKGIVPVIIVTGIV
ncbi:17353_t:CDS:1, partial [Dentiscutata erythropus]